MKTEETSDRVNTPGKAPARKPWSPPQLTALDAGEGTGFDAGTGSDGGACFNYSYSFTCNICICESS